MNDKPLSHISIQIATPAGDSKYDREYALSLINTLNLLEQLGATVDWAELPGCSDLPLARAKILGNFIRKGHTHLLMIDSDMGWNPHDVVRMLSLKRDFIGVAGPKKVYAVEFALNNCDDHGNTHPILFEADTGVMDITELGMAFVLITKECANRMVKAYNHLEFDGGDGNTEYAVFDPFIIPATKRRLPEDFAFCWRWRRIGGKVEILPDVCLQHVGRHVWQGALSDTFGREHVEQADQT